MPHRRFVTWLTPALVITGALWLSACEPGAADPTAVKLLTDVDEVSEPLALSVRHRQPLPDERLPSVQVDAAPQAVRIRVERPAFCATIAQGAVARATGRITVIARVGSNPAVLCALVLGVVEYDGVVSTVPPGSYRVWVYEAVGDQLPRLLSVARVSVPAS